MTRPARLVALVALLTLWRGAVPVAAQPPGTWSRHVQLEYRLAGHPTDQPPAADCRRLTDLIEALDAAVPVDTLRFRRVADVGGVETWEYEFQPTGNTRTWVQTLSFPPGVNPSDPPMTFAGVTGAWKQSEFQPHRAVRDYLLFLRRSAVFDEVTAELQGHP